MDIWTWTIEFLKVIAWPGVVLLVVYEFKEQLVKVASEVTELEMFGGKAKFDRAVKKASEQVQSIAVNEAAKAQADVTPAPQPPPEAPPPTEPDVGPPVAPRPPLPHGPRPTSNGTVRFDDADLTTEGDSLINHNFSEFDRAEHPPITRQRTRDEILDGPRERVATALRPRELDLTDEEFIESTKGNSLIIYGSPPAAMANARTQLEQAVRRLLRRNGVKNKFPGKGLRPYVDTALAGGLIDVKMHSSAQVLYHLGSKVVHGDVEPDAATADEYVSSVHTLVATMLSKPRQIRADQKLNDSY